MEIGMSVDVVVLTDSRYVNPTKRSSYVDNVLLEDRLVLEALQKLGLKTIRKSWDDPEFDWSSKICPLPHHLGLF